MQRSSALIIAVAVLVLGAVIGFLIFSGSTQPPGGESVPPSATGAPSASASMAGELLDRRWTVLLVGTDLNERRADQGDPENADALLLASLSADQSRLVLVSLPRDTVDVPLADGGTYDGKINGLYRERGMEELVGAMEALYGVSIDAHVKLDMDDFARLVAAVDGVEVAPPEPITDPIVNLDLPAGPQELDASQTLGYVRTRVDQDYGRMARQQEVIVALVERLVDPETDVDLRSLLGGLESLETDLPLEQLPALSELARRAVEAEIEAVVIRPPLITFEGDRNDGRGYVLEADFDAIRDEVQGLIGE